MDEIMEQQPQRPVRRRKKQLPQWERTLRRYWPPVRFGLLILIVLSVLLLMLSGMVSCVASLIP